jgi:hypothetical protein
MINTAATKGTPIVVDWEQILQINGENEEKRK